MESIVEFALYTWVVVSILAVLVQLVRIVRYRRANTAETEAGAPGARAASTDRPMSAAAPSIDLERPDTSSTKATEPVPASTARAAAPTSVSSSATDASMPPQAATAPPEAPAPPRPAPDLPEPAPQATTPPPEPTATDVTPGSAATTPVPDGGPTLADLLAGVRLPWNLLPTVDQQHQPSNDRVALLTDEGEPTDVGADVADELERLGFSISTRGEDTAIATRGEHALGLQIIPDAVAARVGDEARFPSASPTSVALDIWIES